MKNLTRLSVLFILILLLMGCVPSPVDIEEEDVEDNGIDFVGLEYIIMQFSSNTLGSGNPMLYITGSALADAALARIAEIEEDYNCDIRIDYYNKDGKWQTQLQAAAAARQHMVDMFFSGNSDATHALIRNKYLYSIFDLNDIIGYDSSTFDIYGTPNLLEPAMYGGELYMVSPYSHPARQLKSGQFFAVNTELVSSLSGVDIRALNEQKQWNWSSFENLVRLCTVVEDGTVTVYGSSSSKSDFIEYALLSNGFTRVGKNSYGEYVPTLNTPNVTYAIDWVRKIINEYSDSVYFESRSKALARFSEGGSAMYLITTEYLKNKVIYQPNEFAVVPFPCGPYGDPETNHGSIALEGMGVYAYADAPEDVAHIIKAYCRPFEDYPTFDSVMEYYNEMFWDTRDVDVMMNAEKYVKFSYYTVGGGELTDAIVTHVNRMSSAQIIQSYAHRLDDVIEEWIIPNNELIDKLTGE